MGTDALSVALTSDADFAAISTLVLNNGTLLYTPGLITNAGTDTITYTVTDTVTGAVTNETQNVTLLAPATNDFYGDGTSNILFQNSNSGLLLDWQDIEEDARDDAGGA